jgi:hypothetical protein
MAHFPFNLKFKVRKINAARSLTCHHVNKQTQIYVVIVIGMKMVKHHTHKPTEMPSIQRNNLLSKI